VSPTAGAKAHVAPPAVSSFPLAAPKAGILAADTPTTAALGTFMTTTVLGVGTWLVTLSGLLLIAAGNACVMDYKIAAGTATAAFAGAQSGSAGATVGTGTGYTDPFSLATLVTVTVAGTLVFQQQAPSAGTILNVSDEEAFAGATGWTATRVA
jgi:hypothetical protein